MVGDDDSDILVLEFGDDVLDILYSDRVDTCKRFIEKDELRVDGQGAGYFATAALTTGKLDTLALADLVEVELIKKVFQTLLPLLLSELLGHLHDGHDVVLNAHVTEYRCLLSEVSDTLLGSLEHRKISDLLIVKEDSSGIRNDKSGDHIEAGRLSRSVRTEESNDLSLVHFHRNPFHNSSGAIFLNKIFAT